MRRADQNCTVKVLIDFCPVEAFCTKNENFDQTYVNTGSKMYSQHKAPTMTRKFPIFPSFLELKYFSHLNMKHPVHLKR